MHNVCSMSNFLLFFLYIIIYVKRQGIHKEKQCSANLSCSLRLDYDGEASK